MVKICLTKKIKNLILASLWKKKIGNAVVRNKIKRRLRSAVQENLQNKKTININYSYIIFGKSKTFDEKYSVVFNELDKTFSIINQITSWYENY